MKATGESIYNKIFSIFKKYGLNETLIKVISGAIIGILFSLGFLTSCTSITAEQIERLIEVYNCIQQIDK
jgi:hypothetical protein